MDIFLLFLFKGPVRNLRQGMLRRSHNFIIDSNVRYSSWNLKFDQLTGPWMEEHLNSSETTTFTSPLVMFPGNFLCFLRKSAQAAMVLGVVCKAEES
jgi:hypothetical protein